MSSYRCTTCNVNWPFTVRHRNCPLCKAQTWVSNSPPISKASARSVVAHEEFERFYEEREIKRRVEAAASMDFSTAGL